MGSIRRLKIWFRANRTEAILLLSILLLAAFFRLWRIDEYLPFMGDEGRDVRVIRRFLTDFDLMFIGPRTSIGDMYLGPLYYYLASPFLWIFGFSPVGPAVFVALLGTATVGLVWFVSREWFGKTAAGIAVFLYAISPVVISFSRHSWNPNIMPFFSLLSVYGLWRVWQRHEWKWLIILGISFAFVLQSHYLGLLLVPTIGIFWLATLFQVISKKQEAKRFLVFSLFAFSLFTFLMFPLVIFDAKHGWRNFVAMEKFFTERQTTVSVKPWNAIPHLLPLWNRQVTTDLVAAKDSNWGQFVGMGIFVGTILLLLSRVPALHGHSLDKSFLSPLSLVTVWVLMGLFGLSLYKQAIYIHYFGFMFTVPFILAGVILQEIWNRRSVLAMVVTIGLVWINIQENPLKYPPQRQMQRVQEIDKKIIKESDPRPFNFALIAKRNYEEGYLYFFELWNVPVKEIDPQRYSETATEQLYVVCEETVKPGEPDPCNPINHPKAEIANFGWAKIEKEWQVDGFRLFKLVHSR